MTEPEQHAPFPAEPSFGVPSVAWLQEQRAAQLQSVEENVPPEDRALARKSVEDAYAAHAQDRRGG